MKEHNMFDVLQEDDKNDVPLEKQLRNKKKRIREIEGLKSKPYDQLNELRAPVVAIPTVLIPPEPLICTVTAAPTRGAIPNPPVDPTETTTPPLGRLFWFTSEVLIT